ncbi:hypothetical protein B484DRAFT_254977 [Ochromonadaceae sp. CCMP2298]|nr:hypothetical protein B484DRAFT_254977 [Ochromonadaceae sp. CCMP2298]
MTMFKPATEVTAGCFVLVNPPANRGGPALCPVTLPGKKDSPTQNLGIGGGGDEVGLQIEFQRQKFNYIPASKLGGKKGKYPHGVLALTVYPTSLPLTQYLSSTGVKSEAEAEGLALQWGKNHLAVAVPSFLELLQVLNPLILYYNVH